MSAGSEKSFVLFPLGSRRFALPAEKVTELAKPDRLQTFPQSTPLLAGVLVRRGRIVPVCDVAHALVGPDAPARKFYLIANRQFEERKEWTAIPVTGECELTSVQPQKPAAKLPDYVLGVLSLENDIVEVLDLEKLITTEAAA
ncbi:MAG TPA: chemotaxis protein CheW [Candidatus Angelobacter sp.]|nr:chemotaxis protein CheW [Candidatus Angelobacter sp.]